MFCHFFYSAARFFCSIKKEIANNVKTLHTNKNDPCYSHLQHGSYKKYYSIAII